MNKFFEEHNGNKKHDENAGSQDRSNCGQAREVGSSEAGGS